MFKLRYSFKFAGSVRSWLLARKSVVCLQDLGGADSRESTRTKRIKSSFKLVVT